MEDIKSNTFSDDFDSAVSTPYASAPSSPGRTPPDYSDTDVVGDGGGGFFYSAPASPMHHMLSSSSSVSSNNLETAGGSFEFELTSGPPPSGSMSSADELFLNGQIRPMKLSSHLEHPQDLPPGENGDVLTSNFRDFKSRDRRRRARSMSPLRSSNTAFQWLENGRDSTEINEIKLKLASEEDEEKKYIAETETEPSSGASSRSSSAGRSSKRWVFLKEFLHRSKSEGRNTTTSNKNHKFWSTLSLRKPSDSKTEEIAATPKSTAKKAVNGVVGANYNRKARRSAHEMHYTTNRAQAEELRRKTYLPYRQGLLGCLGFSSKGYGAMNGFARALNPTVSSR
uniref:uncharacterized protein LOC122596069 n=1 Tax=Erigeron canadensis TaxID=72917 RepID=UPI001CB9125A|nr:uncharacterized protein LOC122596069 [Erigeron canadensis]